MSTARHPIREVRLGPCDVVLDRRSNGVIYVRSPHPLGPYPEKMTQCLEHWAAVAPDRTFLAERGSHGNWRRLTYAEARAQARRIARLPVHRGLDAERP